jgi:hypothetical protein
VLLLLLKEETMLGGYIQITHNLERNLSGSSIIECFS